MGIVKGVLAEFIVVAVLKSVGNVKRVLAVLKGVGSVKRVSAMLNLEYRQC